MAKALEASSLVAHKAVSAKREAVKHEEAYIFIQRGLANRPNPEEMAIKGASYAARKKSLGSVA